jgi:hypothetical protein
VRGISPGLARPVPASRGNEGEDLAIWRVVPFQEQPNTKSSALAAARTAGQNKGPGNAPARSGAPIVFTRRNCCRSPTARSTATSDQGWRQAHRGRPDQDHQDDWCQCSSLTPSTRFVISRSRAFQNGKGATPRCLLGGFSTCVGQSPTVC